MNYCGKEMYKFIKFGFVGILNTLINWIIFAILNICGVYYLVSNFIAYIVATINSYIWNSKWVFKYNGERRNETTIKFIVLNLIGLVLNTSILYLLVDKLLVDKLIALIITTLIVMVINYIANKMWVFK
ncbi:GtrA family protein [uncultured Clostridium sp.]|jgi:putative flippase GtrA|uniref:GtrA family protein n=1 Tax=uncultured Clostridium sp. TaxID=59620 RepID=UPI00262ACCCA|nr:GtrA family protein [uncultured Clostridium sp.]